MLSDDIMDAKARAPADADGYESYDAPFIGPMRVEGEAISRFGAIDAEEVSDGVYRIRDMV